MKGFPPLCVKTHNRSRCDQNALRRANGTGGKTSTEVSFDDFVRPSFNVPCPMPDRTLHRCAVHGTRESDGTSIFSLVCSCLSRMPSCPESARSRTNTSMTFWPSLPTFSLAFSWQLSRGPRNWNGERSCAAFERQRSLLRLIFAAPLSRTLKCCESAMCSPGTI